MVENKEKGDGDIPESVVEATNSTVANLKELQTNLHQFLSLVEPQLLALLAPLQRAHVYLLLAKSATTLFTLQLRCKGVDPNKHSVNTELERLSLYEDKLERYSDGNKEPLRPSTKINYKAATRFIEHSLPDLTPEQKRCMRDISRGEGASSRTCENQKSKKKRKYASSGKQQSIQAAAQEFLEKAK